MRHQTKLLLRDAAAILLFFGVLAAAVTVAHVRTEAHVQHSQSFAAACVAYWQGDISLTAPQAEACDKWRNPADANDGGDL